MMSPSRLFILRPVATTLLIGIVKKNAIMMIDFALDVDVREVCIRATPSLRRVSCGLGRS